MLTHGHTTDHKTLVQQLRLAYRRIARTKRHPPPWALQRWNKRRLMPPVPFVGSRWRPGGQGILIYASAENPPAEDKLWSWRDPWLRHHEIWNLCHTEVGIAPFDRGGLACAAALLRSWSRLPQASDYRDLVERIAVGNLSKFIVKRKTTNLDPNPVQLRVSLPYVDQDIAILKPRIVLVARIVPEDMSEHIREQCFRVGATTLFMPQYSFRTFYRYCVQKFDGSIDARQLQRDLRHASRLFADLDPLDAGPFNWYRLLRLNWQRSQSL